MTIALSDRTMPNTGGWQDRHDSAMRYPRLGFESAIVSMLNGWTDYARAHLERYESPIGDDGVLGPEWQAIGQALIGLLNGETRQLDCGTLDHFLRTTMAENGVEAES